MSNKRDLRELKRLCQAHGATMEVRDGKGSTSVLTVKHFGRTMKLTVGSNPKGQLLRHFPSRIRRFLADASPPPRIA